MRVTRDSQMGILELIQSHCHVKHLIILNPREGEDCCTPSTYEKSLLYRENKKASIKKC